MNISELIPAGGHKPAEDVVLVRRQNQRLDRRAHATGEIARENVAEVAGRHTHLNTVGAR